MAEHHMIGFIHIIVFIQPAPNELPYQRIQITVSDIKMCMFSLSAQILYN